MLSSGDLSGWQYRFVKLGSAGAVAKVTAVTDKVFGVLQNTPTTGGGDAASVMVSGISKMHKDSTSAAIEVDDLISATTGGGAQQTTGGNTAWCAGIALEAMAQATTGVVSVMLYNACGLGTTGT